MNATPTVLLVGTADTKGEELAFMRERIVRDGGRVLLMDVGVLGRPALPVDIGAAQVAQAGGDTLDAIAAAGDENVAMSRMAAGAAALAAQFCREGRIDGVLALGGTMGTDLALDVTSALPLGMPKVLVSTIAHSHLIPPERLAPDLIAVLWAGGLYGLNAVCRSILSQACGAVLGACRAATPIDESTPTVAITSFGTSALTYITRLKPALEARGYEVPVFHCTGMGGRAFESLARQRRFVAVLDLCLAEVADEVHGSIVTSGPDRLEGAGETGIPQIVAPGGADQIDLQTWKTVPAEYSDRRYHAHNRLLASVLMAPEERRRTALTIGEKLARAKGPVAFVSPRGGIEAWDRAGGPLHDPAGLQAFFDELARAIRPPVVHHVLDAHINDHEFSDRVLAIFDAWVEQGVVARGQPT